MNTRLKNIILRINIPILVLIATQAFSQNDCGQVTLNEARKKYEIGNFHEVITTLEPCMLNGFEPREKIQAYKLVAEANLAVDSIDAAMIASAKLLELNPNFEPDLFDPPGFIGMINKIKQSGLELLVTSVSKKAENVLKAPATVMIITEEDIKNRGYQDVEQVFHDLPGFDISKGRGANYSNLYQRGYRSILTDRTILLIDGVEQNDLSSDNAPISRQYPLSNIKRIEIIYGPASTMYGANAFVGVVNIVTKSNDELMRKDNNIGINVTTNYSTYNTQYLDAVLAGRGTDVSFSLTGRYYRSNEMDLSGSSDWNFDPEDVNYFTKMKLSGKNTQGKYLANVYVSKYHLDTVPDNGLYQITYDTSHVATSISLTDKGAAKARELDNNALNPEPGKNAVGFDGHTIDWYLKGKLQFKNFTFAIETWRTNESSAPWYSDNVYLFRNNFTRWINWNSNFYINYEKQISEKLLFTSLTSYRLHSINGGTNFESFKGFYNGVYSFYELALDKNPVLTTTYYYRASNQIKDELRLLWSPLGNLDIMSGIEFRSSMIQGDYLKSTTPCPDETGTIKDQGILGTDHFRTFDLGVYSQATYSIFKKINCVLGARADHNQIRQHGGYGTVFNPRVALVYSPGNFIFKIIYATAFKDASYLQKYATLTGVRELPNPTLKPEKVKNIEINAYWKIIKDLSVDVAAFDAYYSDVVGTAIVTLDNGKTTGQFQPIGKQQIYGGQANAQYTLRNYSFWGNYTFTKPIDTRLDERISDIAEHQFNIGANALFFKHLNINVRTNYVGARKTGAGTSGSQNPNTRMDPYMLFHGDISYNNIVKGLCIDAGVTNILNKKYYDPGVREATGTYASLIPQAGRVLMIKLSYRL